MNMAFHCVKVRLIAFCKNRTRFLCFFLSRPLMLMKERSRAEFSSVQLPCRYYAW